MIGITNGLGTIYTADKEVTTCTFELPQEVIFEDDEMIIYEGCE